MLPSGFRKSVSAEAVAHMTWGPLSHSLSLSLSLSSETLASEVRAAGSEDLQSFVSFHGLFRGVSSAGGELTGLQRHARTADSPRALLETLFEPRLCCSAGKQHRVFSKP